MTEVPSAILWIASIGLITMTVLMCLMLLAITVLIRRVRKLVDKLYEVAEPLKGAAERAGDTVNAYSSNLLRPLATVVGALAGFNKGVKSVSRKAKGRK
ncbi:MAG TPA: hypothetical protein VIF43_00695 [Patescibacteria group bacterium]|jgi:hypothetical protein